MNTFHKILDVKAAFATTKEVGADCEDWIWRKLHSEKYAELIVRECIKLISPTEDHEAFADDYIAGVEGLALLNNAVNSIKEKFGIE